MATWFERPTAAEALAAYQVARWQNGVAIVADPEDLGLESAAIGVVVYARLSGQVVKLQVYGRLTNSSWAWTPDQLLYAGAGGELTQSPPAGVARIVAVALTATTIWIDTRLANDASGITAIQIRNWDDAYGWGDHADAGYLTAETDPVFAASPAAAITTELVGQWDDAYGWGDHAGVGYLTAETDPVFAASPAAAITTEQIGQWDDAYGWGDHAGAGYLVTPTAVEVAFGMACNHSAVRANTPTGTTRTIDWRSGCMQRLTLSSATGTVTLTFTAPAGPAHLTLFVSQGATARSLSWPDSVKWDSNGQPTWSGDTNKTRIVVLVYDGTNYYAAATPDYS